MAKLPKRLKTLINKMAVSSLKQDGSLDNKNALIFSKQLQRLPQTMVIFALDEFIKAIKRGVNKTTLEVESVIELPDRTLKSLVRSLSPKFKISRTGMTVNSALLGGLRVKVGDTLIDGSIKERVNQLKEKVISG